MNNKLTIFYPFFFLYTTIFGWKGTMNIFRWTQHINKKLKLWNINYKFSFFVFCFCIMIYMCVCRCFCSILGDSKESYNFIISNYTFCSKLYVEYLSKTNQFYIAFAAYLKTRVNLTTLSFLTLLSAPTSMSNLYQKQTSLIVFLLRT